MYEDKKNTSVLLVLFTSIIYVFIAIFIIFLVGLSKVEAASYYFDVPRFQNFCKTDIYGYCGDFAVAYDKHMNANGIGQGNYYNVTYMASKNINGVTGTDFIAGEYSVSFSGELALVPGYTLNTNRFRIRLLYYPTSNNEYGIATCDNNENFTISQTSVASNVYKYTYTCETLQISAGKSYLGWNIYITPTAIGPDPLYFVESYITQNLTLIGEGEATNNDIINNQNQNQQQTNDRLDNINGSLTNPSIDGADNTAGGFFGSFSDTDHGGLSGIITAPLVAFNQMLTGTCIDLSVQYKGSTTTLPCGSSFWNQISPIRDFLNITLGGLICYQIVRKLFLLIQKIKNPDDDRVEVMSL